MLLNKYAERQYELEEEKYKQDLKTIRLLLIGFYILFVALATAFIINSLI